MILRETWQQCAWCIIHVELPTRFFLILFPWYTKTFSFSRNFTLYFNVCCITYLQWERHVYPKSIYRVSQEERAKFGRVLLMLNYTDITQNTYIQSWTFTEIMAIEKCGFLGCPRTVSRTWRHTRPLRMPGNEKPLANIGIQWPWRDNEQLRPA